MAIGVDSTKCNSCDTCVEVCLMDIKRLDEKCKPYIKYDECWYCASCEVDCPIQALKLILFSKIIKPKTIG